MIGYPGGRRNLHGREVDSRPTQLANTAIASSASGELVVDSDRISQVRNWCASAEPEERHRVCSGCAIGREHPPENLPRWVRAPVIMAISAGSAADRDIVPCRRCAIKSAGRLAYRCNLCVSRIPGAVDHDAENALGV